MSEPAPGAPSPRILHVLNGDATAEVLAASGIPGTPAVWAEILYEGPVPTDLSSPAGAETRARFLAERGYVSREEALATLARWNASLDSFREFDETVLWLEHDLFDQLLLLHHLQRFARLGADGARLGLVCIGEHPEVEPFLGLGQLSPPMLPPLFAARTPISPRELEIGQDGWAAFTSPDPLDLEAFLERDLSPLPFLAPALRRLLEEYPAVGSGLSRTERQILEIAGEAPLRAADLFRALHRRERFYFETDASLAFHLRELSAGPRPLLAVGPPDGGPGPLPGRVELTDLGRRVLEGREDRVRIAGIDRWIGGVHLHGREAAWRWDADAGRLVRGRG